MLITRLNVLVLAAVVGSVVGIEHAQRIRIEAPKPVEASAQAAAACPANESVPFSPECMAFIGGTSQPATIQPPIRAAASSSELP